jgi:hypothetical protein
MIRYAHTDNSRQTIPWVEYKRNGQTREYLAAAKREDIAKMEIRERDCMDCYNRPSHAFEVPERAVDRAMASGDIPRTMPEVKKHAVEILKKPYVTSADAEREIPRPSVPCTQTRTERRPPKATLSIFQRNVFPEMRVTWGTYPIHIGHTDFPGCFRCHDEAHSSEDGTSITQDCNTCHQLLPWRRSRRRFSRSWAALTDIWASISGASGQTSRACSETVPLQTNGGAVLVMAASRRNAGPDPSDRGPYPGGIQWTGWAGIR